MGQGGAFVELITVRRGAYSRRYIQTALKVVVINPPVGPLCPPSESASLFPPFPAALLRKTLLLMSLVSS